VQHFDGEPHGREGQPLRWLAADDLRHEDFPQANGAIIRAIQLPDYLALASANADAGTIKKISDQLPNNSLIRLRNNGATDVVMQQITGLQQREQIVQMLHKKNLHKLIIDLADAHDASWKTMMDIHGVHANRHVLKQLTQRPVPEHLLFGASCHNADELKKAAYCRADYALLSPVLSSSSHPEQHGMGWEKFGQLAMSADIAIYAMGGLQKSDFEKARACGARGIAGIRLYNAA
jgi:8-oxo-dGTP diphosphatase